MIRVMHSGSAAARTARIAISGALLWSGCGGPSDRSARAPAAERVDTVLLSHIVGTNLPPWAACYFPHLANPYARRRAGLCPPGVQARRVYEPDDLVGCWKILRANSDTIGLAGFAGPVRLMRGASAKLRERGWSGNGLRGVQYMAPIPDAGAMDTAMTVAFWDFAPPDSLTIGTSTGFGGANMTFRVRGDSLVGMLQFGGDVIREGVDTTSDPVERLAGHRVSCSREHSSVSKSTLPVRLLVVHDSQSPGRTYALRMPDLRRREEAGWDEQGRG